MKNFLFILKKNKFLIYRNACPTFKILALKIQDFKKLYLAFTTTKKFVGNVKTIFRKVKCSLKGFSKNTHTLLLKTHTHSITHIHTCQEPPNGLSSLELCYYHISEELCEKF